MDRGHLFVISGPSGTGKGTICKKMLSEKMDLTVSVSMTTRPKRKGEVHGKNYYFVTESEFEKIRTEEGFLEWARVYNNYYGTPKEAVLKTLSQGKDVVLEIDIQGAANIKKAYPEAVFIFILPPSLEELAGRIKGRGTDSKETIELRLSKAMDEIVQVNMYDYHIVNDDLEGATNIVKAIILAEHHRVCHDCVSIIDRYKEEL